jgi:hypothetical protein
MRKRRWLLPGALAALAFGVGAHAQATAAIEGQVVDLSGKPLPSTVVQVYDPASSLTIEHESVASNGSFSVIVPRAAYVLIGVTPGRESVFARADARSGDVRGLVLRVGERTPAIPETPPRAALISTSAPDANNHVVVSGAPGSVPGGTWLVLMTLDTGHAAITDAADDGSFQATLFAPRGSSILIKADSLGLAKGITGPQLRQGNFVGQLPEMAGTIVRVADPAGGFGAAGNVGNNNQQSNHGLAAWTFEGTMTRQPNALEINGVVRLISPALQSAGTMGVRAGFKLHKVAHADGSGSLAHSVYVSTLMTPTGLPIEREVNQRIPQNEQIHVNVVKTAPDRAEAQIRLTIPLGSDVPAGYYVPTVRFQWDNVPVDSSPSQRLVLAPLGNSVGRGENTAYLPVLKIGEPAPPRLPVMLLADTLSDGSHGAQAIEDEQRFSLAARVRVQQSLVVPRVDANGQPHTYRLEPYAPTVLVGVSNPLSVPLLPFRFPSGSLTVRIQRPSGAVTAIGPAPFVQSRLQGKGLHGTAIRDERLESTAAGGNVVRQVYQLTTGDPRFEVQFGEDGLHVITVDGTIEDIHGNTWTLGGTFEIHVGRLLSLDTATMPGTPFVTGDVLSAGVTIAPPVAADVRVRVRHAPSSDGARMIDRTITGRANRFGQFLPRGGFTFDQPGEYRVDVFATHVDANGAHWTGARTWGGVVAPANNSYIGHGRRGMVNSEFASFGSPWYFRSQTPLKTLPDASHPMPPFHNGDVFWAQKLDSEFVTVTIQDPSGALEGMLKKRVSDSGIALRSPGTFDERALLGELPLVSSRADAVDPHIDPAKVDLWGYSYRFVERPRIAVRELIAEDGVQLAYWSFNDPYAGQLGMGFEGDLPNDFKFHWGGAVLRGSALPQPAYAIYGSLFVLVPDGDARGGSRIFPPFSSEGGPLSRLKGQDIDLFFHPTGVRPGSILHKGQLASFAGYSAPALPSLVTIELTSPSGRKRTIAARANAIGYVNDPGQDFVIDEMGVWRANARIVFDGRVPSTNAAVEPHPSGGVLGSRGGEFWFYAVDPESPPLDVAANGFTFTIAPPAGLTALELHTTVTMPGFVLEETRTNTLSYTYERERLAAHFPNLTAADTITVSFVVSGTDSSGVRRHRARQIVLQGAELQMPRQEAWPATFRRRSVR